MEKLKQEDKDKLSKILNDNWDLIFTLLAGSSVDEDAVPYKEVYKWELQESIEILIENINIHLHCNNFFSREYLKDWLVGDIAYGLLRNVDCRDLRFIQCVNQLYNIIFRVLKPYYVGLYPINMIKTHLNVIETNLTMKDGQVYDYQSRVVEIENWDDYVSMFTDCDGMPVDRFKPITNMLGCSIPKDVKIGNLVYDEKHLSCDFTREDGFMMKKLAYQCELR